MHVVIDASNIRGGGGLTHLVGVLSHLRPESHGVEMVTVWAPRGTLRELPCRPWLKPAGDPMLDRSWMHQLLWQRGWRATLGARSGDILFVPGGTYVGRSNDFVTMAQNLLPFLPGEKSRYGASWQWLRLSLLRRSQSDAFRRSRGTIFLTWATLEAIEAQVGPLSNTAVIPHGVADRFRRQPLLQKPLSSYTIQRPFRWLYVSTVDVYKHQWRVVEAVASLRRDGVPITLDLVGPAYGPALRRLRQALTRFDPCGGCIRYLGPIPHHHLHEYYHRTDGFVYASSCETFGEILLEAMASGLPIACSTRMAMPELLGEAGAYFDPEKPDEIARALLDLVRQPQLRQQNAWRAYRRSQEYSWERCADETFKFIDRCCGDGAQ